MPPYYLAVFDSNYNNYFYIVISGPEQLDNLGMMIGDSLIDNGDGTFTVDNASLVTPTDWYNNYDDYKGHYTCGDTSTICTEENLRIISSYGEAGYTYAPNRFYGSSVIWDGSNYTLVDPIEIENYNNLTNLSNHHYMCLSNGMKTCSVVAYIYQYTGSDNIYYITLRDGVESVTEAMENMLTKNTSDSMIKTGVDAWYRHTMIPYEQYLEDTIFCNDRSIRSLGAWNSNGGMTNEKLQFKEYSMTKDLSCTNETDKFSVSNNNAKLTYKVALMSSPEMNLLMNHNIRKTGYYYWLMSPYDPSYVRLVRTGGDCYYDNSSFMKNIRPAVSLIPGIEFTSGDGSMANPYVVKMN